ncbi:hypothetical protein KX721_14525 [Klebsiella quasipneumoniae]|uniref:hypothetical protein n=1 Tax=Klebsiella quasipneumoniae TaxID=1463165 RepID=UPI001CA3C482|nr:hypothetical protein [Klebsiella quasipneumoniae]MBY8385117.1 hypothetical protein [Klebsiella quasipneumoniae]
MEAKGNDFSAPTFKSFEEALNSTKDGDAFYIRQQDIQDLIKRKSADEAKAKS